MRVSVGVQEHYIAISNRQNGMTLLFQDLSECALELIIIQRPDPSICLVEKEPISTYWRQRVPNALFDLVVKLRLRLVPARL